VRIAVDLSVEQVIDRDRRVRLLKEVHAVPLERGALALVRKRRIDGRTRAPVVLIHGYAQNRYAFHLSRRSFSAFLGAAGYDVWSLDLRGVGRSRALGSPPAASFDDHVDRDLPSALDAIRAETGERRAFLVGHSLGGAVACAVAGRHPELVRGVVSLAGVYRFGGANRAIRTLAALAAAFARLPVSVPSDLLLPTDWVGRALALSRAIFDSPVAALFPLRAWLPGAMEADIIDESLRRAFEPASLGVTLGLARLACGGTLCDCTGKPLLAPFAERRALPILVAASRGDDLICLDDARGAYDESRSSDKTFLDLEDGDTGGVFGHMDMLLGRRAPEVVWSAVRSWLDPR
jgi:pimeloyl-ACP methyl ester carboxylesterase